MGKRVMLVVAALCAGVLTMSGCTGYQSYKEAKYSGFLSDYPQFEKGREGVDKVWIKHGVDWKKYDKIMMDELTFFFSDEDGYKGVSPEDMKELSDAANKAFVGELKSGYTFTDQPGPDVLRLRMAITGVKKGRPALNTVSTVMPIGLGLSIVKKGATGEHTAVGNASMEMEALDSMSGERLAAAIDFRPGGKLEGFTGYGAAKAAFGFWAKRARARLDELRGVKAEK